MSAQFDRDASSTWSFEPTWDPNAAWDSLWQQHQQPTSSIGGGSGGEPWDDFPPFPDLTSDPTVSPASSLMMTDLTPQFRYSTQTPIVSGDTSASASVCAYNDDISPIDNSDSNSNSNKDSPFHTISGAPPTRPKIAARRRSAVLAPKSAAAAAAAAAGAGAGRSRSWSAAVTAAPMYKYVAHAQLSMQSGQPKNCLENQNAWLQIARISNERHRVLADRFVLKKGATSVKELKARADVDHVLALFSQHYVREKVAILAREHVKHERASGHVYDDIGDTTTTTTSSSPPLLQALQRRDLEAANKSLWLDQNQPRTAAQVKQFPRLTVFDEPCHQQPNSSLTPGLLAVEVRTSSGYSDFTASSTENATLSEWDCDLLQLRHMFLLRESEDRRRKNKYYEFIEGKMKRPLNSFMLYRSALMKAVAILKVCSVVTDTCQVLSSHYPQLTEPQLLAVVGSVVQDVELPFTLPVDIDRDVVLEAIQATMYEPVDTFNPNSELKLVDPKFNSQTDVAQIITLMWNTEPEDFKQRFVEFSQIEKQHHHQVYPKYKYCPVKRERSSA
ncbi:uncharacterized protein LALA0_S10e00254g [Lachancea lanzarotensis]|uniref:LALA0S10e00254g1_1 n=1 Tax=Lachancea lanzarotensis TaxID=1245769 RepID=A0A0C7MVP5_9SACH|nr:uncharacterized protein LALA0_S10e00254g [Lachancea lanzarotensis]CEP64013.1 LALA0S10e00254g1_1 [Lachancea lanzarotensis]